MTARNRLAFFLLLPLIEIDHHRDHARQEKQPRDQLGVIRR